MSTEEELTKLKVRVAEAWAGAWGGRPVQWSHMCRSTKGHHCLSHNRLCEWKTQSHLQLGHFHPSTRFAPTITSHSLTHSLTFAQVSDLKDKLKELDLPLTGKKAELVARLVEHFQDPTSPVAATNVCFLPLSALARKTLTLSMISFGIRARSWDGGVPVLDWRYSTHARARVCLCACACVSVCACMDKPGSHGMKVDVREASLVSVH
jgi:hypothetical protein